MSGAQPMSMLVLDAGLVLAALAAASAWAAEPAAAPAGAIAYELWDRPRNGRAVLAEPAVREAMAALAAYPAAQLLIRHPAGVDGTLQAEELRSWLITHAIAPGRIVVRPGPAARQRLQLEVETAGNR
jgi:hypothetical protein